MKNKTKQNTEQTDDKTAGSLWKQHSNCSELCEKSAKQVMKPVRQGDEEEEKNRH